MAQAVKACDSIEEIRLHIDRIDSQIVALLAERGGYVKQAASFKVNTAEVRAPQRVEEVIRKVTSLSNELGANPAVTERVYRAMIDAFIDAELAEHASPNNNSPAETMHPSSNADLVFLQLTEGWNADLTAPNPSIEIVGTDLLLKFNVDAMQFPDFDFGEVAILRFVNCEQYRLGPANQTGWYRGQCRFSQLAPAWGEFYLLRGNSVLLEQPDDWKPVGLSSDRGHHFLFYFQDSTFECVATQCVLEPIEGNSLVRTGKKLLSA